MAIIYTFDKIKKKKVQIEKLRLHITLELYFIFFIKTFYYNDYTSEMAIYNGL